MMGDSDRQAELAALLDEWNANSRGNGRRRALVRRVIGHLDFESAALTLGLSHDELCSHAFGRRVDADRVRRICASLKGGDEQLVAAAVAAELDVGYSLVRKLAKRFRRRRPHRTHAHADPPRRGRTIVPRPLRQHRRRRPL